MVLLVWLQDVWLQDGALPLRILLVEDDKAVRITVRDALQDAGHDVTTCVDGASAEKALQHDRFELLLTDVRLPGTDGITLFRQLRLLQPYCATILMTAFAELGDAVAVIREGAQDYISKPFELDELVLRIARVAEEQSFRRALAEGVVQEDDRTIPRLIGASASMQLVQDRIDAAADAGVNVLIAGETGTGKELVARTLHARSKRARAPFVALNCAAIPAELFEAEVFGHEKGAFTGADRRREGKLATAHGGTLFLDEVADLDLDHQAKLLRAIESGCFEAVGSDKSQHCDVWVLSAANVDLSAAVDAGAFRRDLYYRLNVIEIALPPLRDRRGDIPQLVSDALGRAVVRRGIPMPGLTARAMAALLTYDYAGNVRELFHALEHGLALARERSIDLEHLPRTFHSKAPTPGGSEPYLPLPAAIHEFETAYIRRVLDQTGGRRGDAAKLLGISRKSLWLKLKQDGDDNDA